MYMEQELILARELVDVELWSAYRELWLVYMSLWLILTKQLRQMHIIGWQLATTRL